MSLMDKFLNVMRLNPEDDDDDYDLDNEDYMDDDEIPDGSQKSDNSMPFFLLTFLCVPECSVLHK